MTKSQIENNLILNFKQIKIFTNSLAEILHNENKLLKQFKINKVNEMAKEKKEIISYLEEAKKTISANPEIIQNHDKILIDELLESSKELEKLTEENFKLITKASLANKKLIDILKNEILKNNIENIVYNQKGSFTTLNKQEDIMPPLTLTDLV